MSWSALAADWPQWRGPNRDGIAIPAGRLLPWPAGGPPSLWTGANSTVWVGNGYSSLAVSGGRLFTLGNLSDLDTVFCLDADTGNILWTNAYPCPRDPNLYNGGPSATPTIDGNVVYTLSKFGHLFCFDAATGHTNWQRNLIDDFGVEKPDWGFAGSPLIEGDRMFLNAGGHGMALNKHTGDLVWLSNTNRGGYSSVVSFDLNGTNAAAFLSYNSAVCVDLADGRLIWSNFWQTPLIVNIPDPIVAGDRIFLTGYKKSARIVRAGDGLDLTGAITVQTHMSPGVVISNHLFAFHGDVAESTGALKCVDLQTGVIRWSTNFGITAGTVGALMAADNKLIVITGGRENSPVQIFLAYASTNSFPVISQFSPLNFSPFCWTPPALVGDRLYVRSGNGAVRAFLLPVDALPRLGIGPRPGVVDLTWPTNATGFTLEKRPLPAGGPDWSGVTNPAVNDAGRFHVTLPATNGQEYFRLRKPM